MNVLDAVRQMVREYPGGAEALMPRINSTMKTQEAFDKALRGDTRFKIGILEAAAIVECCHEVGVPSTAALTSALARLHCATVALAPPAKAGNLLQDMNSLMLEFSDVVREVATAGMDGDYSLNELRRIQREAGEAMAALQRLVADVEAAHASGQATRLRQVGAP